ncbi:Hexose carrier protein HEX6, partial [Linum perenne]
FLPASHRNQRHRLLRSAPLPYNRTRRKRFSNVRRHNRRNRNPNNLPLDANRRQDRSTEALFIGGIQMFISQILVGGIMAAELGDHGGIGKKYAVVVIVLIINYVAGFGLSWGPLGWLVPSEIFPMEIRSAGQSVVE